MFHANYLCFAERARTEWLRFYQIEQATLARNEGIIFAVKNIWVDYITPAKLDDLLTVQTIVTAVAPATLTMEQHFKRNQQAIALVRVKLVTLTLEGKVIRLPQVVKNAAFSCLQKRN